MIGVILAKSGSSMFLVTAYTLELLVAKENKNIWTWHAGCIVKGAVCRIKGD